MASGICRIDELASCGNLSANHKGDGRHWTPGFDVMMPAECDNVDPICERKDSGPRLCKASSWSRRRRRFKQAFYIGMYCAKGALGLSTACAELALICDGDSALPEVAIVWPFSFNKTDVSMCRRELRDPQTADFLPLPAVIEELGGDDGDSECDTDPGPHVDLETVYDCMAALVPDGSWIGIHEICEVTGCSSVGCVAHDVESMAEIGLVECRGDRLLEITCRFRVPCPKMDGLT